MSTKTNSKKNITGLIFKNNNRGKESWYHNLIQVISESKLMQGQSIK